MCPHDGNGTIALELGLMGRRTIYNGDCPSAIHYDSLDDAISLILIEYKHRHEDNTQIALDRTLYFDGTILFFNMIFKKVSHEKKVRASQKTL